MTLNTYAMASPKRTTAIESALSEIEEERKLLSSMEEAQGRALLRPAAKWRTFNLGDRQELQTLLFPDGIKWHPESGFFEHHNAQLWADLLTAYHEEDPAESAAWTVRVPDGLSLCRLGEIRKNCPRAARSL
jgi:hypothetical protein